MANADEAANGSPGGDDSAEPASDRPDSGTRSANAAHNGPTQNLPLVSSPTSGPPVVRAVAKRAAAALPALGGPDGPISARATVNRRRAAAQGGRAAGLSRPISAPPVSAPPYPIRAAEAAAAGPASAATQASSATPINEPTMALWHLPSPSPSPAPTPPAPAQRTPERRAPLPQAGAFGRTDGPGEPLAGDAAGTDENAISGELMAGGSGDLALAGAPARHARPAPAVIAPIRTIAQTGLLPAIPDTFESPSSPSFHEATQAIRTLPPVLDADSWDTEPAEPANQDYNGRRRAVAWPLRIWLVIGLVLTGLSAAVVIPLALGSPATLTGQEPNSDALAGETSFIPRNEGELISAASSPGVQPTRPSTAAVLGPTGGTPTSSAKSPSPTATTGPPGVTFQLTLNAISQASHQSWQVQANTVCNSGQVVLTGNWEGHSQPGLLTFSSVNVPTSGNYFITVYYGTSAGQDRTEDVRINNVQVDPRTVPQFQSGCRNRKFPVSFSKTTGNTIVMGNQSTRGISISQIVISAT